MKKMSNYTSMKTEKNLNLVYYKNNKRLKIRYKKIIRLYQVIPEINRIYTIKLILKIKLKCCAYMFFGCRNLISINLSNFDTKNVTNMSEMFCDCNNLTSINLSNFDTRNVTDMSEMFKGCNKSANIVVNDEESNERIMKEFKRLCLIY